MNKIKSDFLGTISLAAIIIGGIFGICSKPISILFAVISIILAAIDIFLGYKKEQLAFQEYFQVAVKEKTFSVIAIIGCVVFAFFVPLIITQAQINSLF